MGVSTSKRLENAYKHFAKYIGQEYAGLSKACLLILTYSFRQSKITLIGTRHIHRERKLLPKIQKGITSEALRYLRSTSKNKRIVMVEGFDDVEPCGFDTAEESFKNGEPSGVTFLAKKAASAVMSPEPKTEEQIKWLRKAGFSKENILLFYVARELSGGIGAQTVNNRSVRYVREMAIRLGDRKAQREGISYAVNSIVPRINRAMKGINGKALFVRKNDLIYSNLSTEELYTLANPTFHDKDPKHSTVLNEISYTLGELRDRKIIGEIEKAVWAGRSPFVVYGMGHIARLKPAFDTLYGKATIRKV